MMTPTFPTSTSSSSIGEIRALRIQTTAGRAPRRRRDFTLGGVFSPQAFSEGCHQKPFAHAGELFPAFSGFVEILPTLTTRKASRLLQNFKLFPRHQRPARLSSVSNFSLAFIANSDLEFTAAWKYDHNIDENDSKDEPGFAMICSRETQISGTSRHDNELIPKDEYGKCIIRGKSAKEAAKARQFGRNG
ncbi:unnamed protein product [Notodromas monacha]|uniref:Uncharacterized protein n=1 Tax=Notodromas monacha TaxID=399045 RepID=A0A7R9C0X0_9CRUS|nr:unnamed protein product [Notodromas monacha]CAG0923977.1 unnamed protein product [Notodromas monacha]